MSRGFVKEDDQEEIPMVPPRADLPEGVRNYVTPAGMDQLLAERLRLEDEKDGLDSFNENERRIAVNFINAKLRLLENRIATARIVDLKKEDPEEVRFGTKVKLKNVALSKTHTLQIVGVDEADFSKGKIAFTSPLARAIINKRAGEQTTLKRGTGDQVFEILKISRA